MKLVYEPMNDLCFVLGLNKRKLKHVKFIKMDGPGAYGLPNTLNLSVKMMIFKNSDQLTKYIIDSQFTTFIYKNYAIYESCQYKIYIRCYGEN